MKSDCNTPDPFHFPIGATSANKSTPLTLSGIVQHAKIVTTAKDTITLMTTALTLIHSASPSPSVWYHSPIVAPSPSKHVGARLLLSMPDTIRMIGDMTVTFELNARLDLSWEATTKSLCSLVMELLLQVLSESTWTVAVWMIHGVRGHGRYPRRTRWFRGVWGFCAIELD